MQKQAWPLQGLSYVEQNAGGGNPGGGQHHRAGDLPAPPAGLALHSVLRLQALQREEEEKEEEGSQPARLLYIIAVSLSSAQPRITSPALRSWRVQGNQQSASATWWKRIHLRNNGVLFHDSTDQRSYSGSVMSSVSAFTDSVRELLENPS